MLNKRNKIGIKLVILPILLILALTSFYQINKLNYSKSRQIEKNIVEHPENLPTKETAKNTSFGFSNLKADLYWLETIQYIWSNAISSEYKKYLYPILDIVTELNPYFEHPYIIWELLLPSYNHRYEKLSNKEKNIYTEQAIKLWNKWIEKFCTATYKDENWKEILKTELIKKEFDLNKLWSEEKYKNPCKSYKIANNLAYVHYFYNKDALTAAQFYKIASANEDSLEWSKIMSAIMQWKWGDRDKSFFMFLNMASSTEEENSICKSFAKELNSLAIWWKLKNDTFTIKKIEETRKQIFKDSWKDKTGLENAWCSNFLNKAIRELNLSYIEKAYKKYESENKNPDIENASELFEKWYLEFLPTDYQQEKDQWIIYFYNKEIEQFDYKMWYNLNKKTEQN